MKHSIKPIDDIKNTIYVKTGANACWPAWKFFVSPWGQHTALISIKTKIIEEIELSHE